MVPLMHSVCQSLSLLVVRDTSPEMGGTVQCLTAAGGNGTPAGQAPPYPSPFDPRDIAAAAPFGSPSLWWRSPTVHNSGDRTVVFSFASSRTAAASQSGTTHAGTPPGSVPVTFAARTASCPGSSHAGAFVHRPFAL
jgi:hypothetical protein